MKQQGAIVNRIVMLVFLAAILLYFAGNVWHGLRDPFPTTVAYTSTVDNTVEATGYLVRTERLVTGGSGIVRLLPGEGEKVAVGGTVALLYADEDSLSRAQQIETLKTEIQQLSSALSEGASDLVEGSSAVLDALLELQVSFAAGDLTDLESQSSDFKQAVYRKAQTYGDSDALATALENTKAQLTALESQSTQNTGKITAPVGGIFSAQADGYENILTPDGLDLLTPASLDTLEDTAEALPAGTVGKLITRSTWYFACTLATEEAGRLSEGQSISVRFSRDWSGTVKMTVERIGIDENGRCVVILSSRKFLSDTTLLRRQSVELVFSELSGLRVPTAAVRKNEDGVTGVYVQVGVKAEFKPVAVLAQGEDFYLVEPLLAEDATDKQTKKALRSGDLVVVATQDIWDGMVLD